MPDKSQIVINTGPLIAIVAATGNLDVLRDLFEKVYVPFEVIQEIYSSSFRNFAVKEFAEAEFLFIK